VAVEQTVAIAVRVERVGRGLDRESVVRPSPSVAAAFEPALSGSSLPWLGPLPLLSPLLGSVMGGVGLGAVALTPSLSLSPLF
jgi:hypothetical protein